ncbi:MAG TPA: hypothetical protein VH442_05800, partial [Micromonosporaceae bacterium]
MPPKAKTAGRTAAATAVATKTATTTVGKTAANRPAPKRATAAGPVRAVGAAKRKLANPNPHPQRKEIARYMLSRGLDAQTLAPSAEVLDTAAAAAPKKIAFPAGLAPVLGPIAADRDPD